MIQGIVLAAGRGSRMKHLTDNKPKSFSRYKNKKLIDIIINNFRINKISNLNIVVGYKRSLFKSLKTKKIFNSKWSSTSIFSSLQCATKILKKNTCIISYADILYKQNAIKLLKQAKGDIVILNNTNWKKTWKKRFKTPLSDLESFNYKTINKNKFLIKIGSRPRNISSIKGQFAGLIKITPLGWKRIQNFIKEEKINIKKLDMTSFFSKFIKKNQFVVKIVDYKNMWFEVDTINDLNILNSKDN